MKRNFRFFGLCLAVASAVSFFLVACGEGDIIALGDTSTDRGQIGEIITTCTTNPEKCIPQVPSSSSQGSSNVPSSDSGSDPSSDSGGIPSSDSGSDPSSNSGGVSSSSQGGTPSSNSGGASSSSQGGGASSSATAPQPGTTCPADASPLSPPPACSWSPSPVVSGDNATVSVNAPNEDCTKRVFSVVTGFRVGVAEFPEGEPIQISGTRPTSNALVTFSWPLSVANNVWPEEIPNGIQSIVTCGDRCSVVSCPIAITAPPAPVITGTFAFREFDYTGTGTANCSSNNAYFIGTNITVDGANSKINNTLSITNGGAAQAGCGDITVEVSGGGLTGTPGAVTTAGVITARAVATCRGTLHVLREITATVVGPPTLSTTACTWDTRNDTWGGGARATVVVAPTIQNQCGRTCTGPYFAVGGTPRTGALSVGLLVDTWTSDPQTMSGITIGASCGGTVLAPSRECPNIVVKDPSATCEYTAVMCPGTAITQVTTAPQNLAGVAGSRCFYATSITDMRGGGWIVNGTVVSGSGCNNGGEWGLPTCTTVLNSIEREDGGYYIYAMGWINNFVTTNTQNGLHPNCR